VALHVLGHVDALIVDSNKNKKIQDENKKRDTMSATMSTRVGD
jgi:hypothetical protein